MSLLHVQTALNRIRQDMEAVGHEGVVHAHHNPHRSALCQYMLSKRDDDITDSQDSLVRPCCMTVSFRL